MSTSGLVEDGKLLLETLVCRLNELVYENEQQVNRGSVGVASNRVPHRMQLRKERLANRGSDEVTPTQSRIVHR